MDNNVYIMLSRQMALFRDLESTANNLANANTVGYNANRTLFTSFMVKDADRGKMAFDHDVSTFRDTTPGTVQHTGNTLDVAITGEGYFSVETPLGIRYTRAGNFQLDSEGTLITAEGYKVLDSGEQPISFSEDDKTIVIGAAGNIAVDGEERATLSVVKFENPQTLRPAGNRLFTTDDEPEPALDATVAQGTLENSNVQSVAEMTHLIDLSRSVTNTAKFVEVMYELQRKNTTSWTQQG